jgi:hypothetical protein
LRIGIHRRKAIGIGLARTREVSGERAVDVIGRARFSGAWPAVVTGNQTGNDSFQYAAFGGIEHLKCAACRRHFRRDGRSGLQ